MAKSKVTFRRNDDSGAGVIVNADDVEKFLETGDNANLYVKESTEERKANQRNADAKAQAQAEDKAVNAPKARG
jgi:hypothetical protein